MAPRYGVQVLVSTGTAIDSLDDHERSVLYESREDTDNGLVLVRVGLPDAADQLARTVYQALKAEHLSPPSLRDECPEWDWYEESWSYLS